MASKSIAANASGTLGRGANGRPARSRASAIRVEKENGFGVPKRRVAAPARAGAPATAPAAAPPINPVTTSRRETVIGADAELGRAREKAKNGFLAVGGFYRYKPATP
jgi:ribosomal protein L15